MSRGLHIRDGLEVVQTRAGRVALISGNSLGFEIDDVTRDVLALCDGRSADAVVKALQGRYEEEEIRGALGELGAVGALVGSLQRLFFQSLYLLSGLLTGPAERLFRRSVRGHGDAVLERVGEVRTILLYTFSKDPTATRIPAAILREKFPEAELHIKTFTAFREAWALRGERFDLSVGVHDFDEDHPHQRFILTWLFGRLARAGRRITYVDRYDFLPRLALPYLLSAWEATRGRCAEALRKATFRAYAACAGLFRAPHVAPSSPRRILVLAPGGIGDVVLTTPALRALRRQHPDAHIACLIPPGAAGLLKACPFINELIPSPIQGRGGLRDLLMQLSFAREIADRRFDLSVTLRHWRGQACDGYLPYLAGVPRRVGPALSGSRETAAIFTHPVAIASAHQADAALEVVRGLGEDRALQLWTTEADRAFVQRHLQGQGIFAEDLLIGVHPGSSAEVKQWPPERLAQAVDRLTLGWGARVILTGGPGEVRLAWEVARHTETSPVVVAGNLTLSQSVALIERCDLLLCGDSGPMHIAAAVGTPLVALFGPTDPRHWGPRTPRHRVVRRRLFCGPRAACIAGPRPECPRGRAACIQDISVEEVVEAAEALLSDRMISQGDGHAAEPL
ncbi:glycosyltransferase family 9 protein [bacterium]|nr:glycosyltransferase family 9 protein [bacterium]